VTTRDSVGLEAKLLEYTKVLETCLLKLDQFVDLKRNAFPRLMLFDRSDFVRLLSSGSLRHANVDLYQAAARACFPGLQEMQV
jgi:hypothetical protein